MRFYDRVNAGAIGWRGGSSLLPREWRGSFEEGPPERRKEAAHMAAENGREGREKLAEKPKEEERPEKGAGIRE